jgi:hypothetical protein
VRAVVLEWAAGDFGSATDATQIVAMLLAQDISGLPLPGDQFDSTQANTGDHLICTQRDVNVISTNKCEITCIYRFINQKFNAPILVRPSNTLVQVNTNKDGDGQTLLNVAYVQDGVTKTQVGEISALSPQAGWRMEIVGDLGSTSPWNIVDAWIGKINSKVYLGWNIESVLITDVVWLPLLQKSGGNKYIFDFEFQVSPVGKPHQPEVMWRDPTTGRVPADVSQGEASEGNPPGRKYADWHDKRDFDVEFVTQTSS